MTTTLIVCNGVAKNGKRCAFVFGEVVVESGRFVFKRKCPKCHAEVQRMIGQGRIVSVPVKVAV